MPAFLAAGALLLAYGLYIADSPKMGKARITKVKDDPGVENVFENKGKRGNKIIVGRVGSF